MSITSPNTVDASWNNAPEPSISAARPQSQKSQLGHLFNRLEVWLLVVLLIAACVAGGFTFAAMREGLTPTSAGEAFEQVFFTVRICLALLLIIALLLVRRLVFAWLDWRKRPAGSQLLRRVTGLFSAVAIVPTVLLTLFAVMIFNIGVQAWFSEPVSTAIQEAEEVAKSYLDEHRQSITIDALEMANDLNRGHDILVEDRQRFDLFVENQSWLRGLNEALVLDREGKVTALGGMSPDIAEFRPTIDGGSFERAETGEMVLLDDAKDDRVHGLVRLQGFEKEFLYLSKLVDSSVVSRVRKTEDASNTYEALERNKERFQRLFLLLFGSIGLLLLLGSILVGLRFASSLATPIGRLIGAATQLGEGDLGARVAVDSDTKDEVSNLSKSFNLMANRIENQRNDLMHANGELVERRQFIEAVLSGVSAGVVGLDQDMRIALPNRMASKLLAVNLDKKVGSELKDVLPEIAAFVEEHQSDLQSGSVHGEIKLTIKGVVRTFIVTAVPDARVSNKKDVDSAGTIVTLDDITELETAQRKAAWSGVARRIAHEIKNPLTPIQLSAERLKRRYSKQIDEEGRETFDTCTDTIIRQVGDIKRMVDEFSNFARTPTPKLVHDDLKAICQQAGFLQANANQDIKVDLVLPKDAVPVNCDSSLVSQATINLLKNAGEAVEARLETNPEPKGMVRLTLLDPTEELPHRIIIQDNGAGIPESVRDKLAEPYVTTREKGTGLGLAIVKKIMEDHGGALTIDPSQSELDEIAPDAKIESLGGATFVMHFGPLSRISH